MIPATFMLVSDYLVVLPPYHIIIACSFRVTGLNSHAALAFSPSDIVVGKMTGYQFIDKMMLDVLSSLCGKRRIGTCLKTALVGTEGLLYVLRMNFCYMF